MSGTEFTEVRLVNDILANLSYLPDDEAATALAGHIERFWDPRMTGRLRERVTADATSVSTVVVAAVAQLR
ncbi:formate dehydrogenase [Mycolicibacterium sp. P1-18]|uniref:formate dehydrogenase subunit delta n=1 Tax=Mycolicibacterium sp. P1-18 TaxID=2024615 RepID=UPI0011F167B5|nr:formate dehydrogenase subunit delta [Mycolicibacterium sp. P1-18]KAA0098993.1 formate dehydrogenase [Mycolicibacterium sp. P1-18]